jgi:hypothetical protein
MKFVDGLANVAGTTPFATATELVSSGLVHPYDLLTEILVQQSQKVPPTADVPLYIMPGS